jgi:integrase
MIYWHVERNSLCIHSQLKSPSSSEVASMIEGVIHHCTEMEVDRQYVDSHGQSTVAFAFCRLLGFQLLPRLKAIHSQTLYRPEAGKAGAYANLQLILGKPVDWELVRQQYDQMVKYTTALRLGTAETEAILRRFTKKNVQHPTYKAFAELGKAIKTIFLCRYLHSEALRREIHEGLNVVEQWNGATDFVFFARRGEMASNRREDSARQTQARALGWREIKEFIGSAGQGLRADRERALLCVAYETLARRSELVALEVRDIEILPDGTGRALIRRGKTDAEGQGRVAYLSRETVKWLSIWLEHAKISDGAIFRRLVGRGHIGGPLNPGSIAPIFKRVAQWIGMPARFIAEVSGHSTRVGAARDLAALDIDLAAITQAGAWKSPRMPLQYAEKINAARSGMARAAAASGRDQSVSQDT